IHSFHETAPQPVINRILTLTPRCHPLLDVPVFAEGGNGILHTSITRNNLLYHGFIRWNAGYCTLILLQQRLLCPGRQCLEASSILEVHRNGWFDDSRKRYIQPCKLILMCDISSFRIWNSHLFCHTISEALIVCPTYNTRILGDKPIDLRKSCSIASNKLHDLILHRKKDPFVQVISPPYTQQERYEIIIVHMGRPLKTFNDITRKPGRPGDVVNDNIGYPALP